MEAPITKDQIQTVVDKIVKEFNPEKVILFGSYAWGTPHEDSDVDLLVVKETEDTRKTAIEIRKKLFPAYFPMDVLVYPSKSLDEKITVDRNLFLEDIVKNGVILYASH